MVYVLDINGQPLMPTTRHGKVRRLLNSHLAKVVKRCPFTIQLLYQSTKEIQPVSLGVDAGSKHIGMAATTEKKVVFTNNRIQIKKDYRGFRVCFLSRLPHLIDDFYGTGVIQFTKHLQQMADYIQGKDLNEYYPFEMDVQEFKEAFVDAYLKIKGYDQPVEDGLFTRFRTAIHSLFNMPTTQHVSY